MQTLQAAAGIAVLPSPGVKRHQRQSRQHGRVSRSSHARTMLQICRSSSEGATASAAVNESGPAMGRRSLLTSVISAPALLFAETPAANAAVGNGKNVIITGANSGIGFDAAAKLSTMGYTVTLACRSFGKAVAAIDRIELGARENGTRITGDLVPAECNLEDLASIRKFAADWHKSGKPIHVLVLNAGLQYSGADTVRRTKDGFEETVGVNHLGHFLLTNLLLPDVEAAGKGARIVITSSEVHDPTSAGGSVGKGAGLGLLAGLERDGKYFKMIDGGAFDPDKAYKDSKLCNLLFQKELVRRLALSKSPVTVNAFGPGLITRTGFFRSQPGLFVNAFDFFANDVFKVSEGGDCLVYMASSPLLENVTGVFFNNELTGYGQHTFKVVEPSDEAQDDREARRLWVLSEKLVGLNTA